MNAATNFITFFIWQAHLRSVIRNLDTKEYLNQITHWNYLLTDSRQQPGRAGFAAIAAQSFVSDQGMNSNAHSNEHFRANFETLTQVETVGCSQFFEPVIYHIANRNGSRCRKWSSCW